MEQNNLDLRLNRGASPTLSSGLRHFMTALLLSGAAMSAWPVAAQSIQTSFDQSRPSSIVAGSIAQWKSLQDTDTLPFSYYANFLIANPGWPNEIGLRKAAEKNLRLGGDSPSQIISYFRKYPALSSTGQLRFAVALAANGSSEEAKQAARLAWIGSGLSPTEEAELLGQFSSALSVRDHDARMEKLLWSRNTSAATRALSLVSPERRAVFEARLALLMKSPDAAAKREAVEPLARGDAGFIVDKVYWYRNTGNVALSRVILSNPLGLTAPPAEPAKWLNSLYDTAKNAANDQQWETVWKIARQIGSTYPPGTIVSERPFEERDDYTSLTWLGGMTSLTKRGRPSDALMMFELYANAARSPQTKAKGLYWAGRAAEASGQRDRATEFYQRAALFFDQFHGQLANERLGQAISSPSMRRTLELSGGERAMFENSSIVKAATYLGATGQWQDQTRFVRTIAANAKSEADHYLASELATKLNRPDLNVLVGRSAREDGLTDYLSVAFPQIRVPEEHAGSWTMIHAITRQESQFDREAKSPVGARGLMQLMPGTAKETAPSAGVSYSLAALTQDPQLNIRLGSTYFSQLMDRFSGSYLLSVAAYNAGPGNVNKWLRANGDPRLPGADVLAWIEAIPLSETRGYVQRVLENAVVYDLLNPTRANIRGKAPLSAYLGKSRPG